MAVDGRTPFLHGALTWLHGGQAPPDVCATCGFDWSVPADRALAQIEESPAIYASLLDGRDGMAVASDGGWNASSYVWHLTDLARSWAERWVQLSTAPGSTLVGWDPDVLADARSYRALPTAAALWALRTSTAAFVDLTRQLDGATPFLHGDWGAGTIDDATRWLAHEFVHHRLDVRERATS